MREWGLHGRALVSEYFPVVVAVLVIVALFGGWLVYSTHLDPAMETDTEVTSSWESTSEYTHQATIQESNRVFPVGTTHEDRSTYFTQLSPDLDVTYRYAYSATGGELDVATDSRLVLRAVGDDGDAMEFWRVENSLENATLSLTPGQSLQVDFTVNVSAVRAELDAIQDDLGASPGETEVFVQTDIAASGTASGESAEHTTTHLLTIDPGGGTYGVTSDSEIEQHDTVEQVTRPVEYGLVRQILGPLLLVLALLGLGVVAAARHSGRLEVSESDRRMLTLRSERREFDDWISRGSASTAATDRPQVQIESLEDLVDVAIDTDCRVIEDIDANAFYVLADDTCYLYEPPESLPLDAV